MSVRTDTVNLNINVNGNKAQNELNNLRKKAADVKFEMDGLKKGTADYIAKSKELAQVNAQMSALKKEIGLTALSQKELINELSKLKALRGSVLPFSNEYKELSKSIKEVEKRLYDVKNGVQGFSSTFSKVSDSVKQFGIVAAGYLGLEFITAQFQNIIPEAGKLSDQLADLQRVAGLTAGEASNLNNQFRELNSRTSTEGLREIAIIAGKLGVAKDDIFEFTKAVDQLVVSLGDELGDAEQITTQLGKILNVFNGEISADGITKLGNAFVELANTGSATGGFIADFDQRLSGIAKSAGIGLGELSGLGAGLEEMGARVESSSTAIQKLVISISDDIPAATKIANVSIEDFTKLGVKNFEELFKVNPTEALLRYSEGLVKNKQSFSDITAAFKDAGEEGARTIETITKLGTGADQLRKRIDLGRESIKESTAITAAFALKNETLGAELEKLGKKFNSLITSKFVTGFVTGLISGFNSLLELFQKNNHALDEFRKQALQVSDLEKNMIPLINRVDELSKQSKLSTDEQIELTKAIQSVGKTIPFAITEFDKYGKAIGISTEKAREFINLQQAILKEKNRDAIKEQNTTLKELEAKELQYQGLLEMGARKSKKAIGDEVDYFNRAIAFNIERLTAVQARIQGIKGIIAELDGSQLAKDIQGVPGASGNANNDIKEKIGLIKKLQDAIKELNDALPGLTSTKAIQENLAQKKKLQDELDKLEGKKSPGDKKDENDFKRIKERAEKFYQEIQDLKKRIDKGDTPEEQEVQRAIEKYAKLMLLAKEYAIKTTAGTKIRNEEEKIIEEEKQRELNEIFQKYFKKRLEEGAGKEYDDSLAARREFSDQLKIAAAKDYADGKISKIEYEQQIKQIEKDETRDRVIIAQDYSTTVKKAATDVKNFRKKEEEETTTDAIEQAEARVEVSKAEANAKLRRAVLTTRPGSKANLDARKDELKKQEEDEVAATTERYAAMGIAVEEGSEIIQAIRAEYNQKDIDLDNDHVQGLIDNVVKYVGYVQQALGSLNQIINNRENAQFNKEKALNNKKRKEYKSQLDNKLISQAQYDKKVNELQEQQDAKERELKRKQAKREKAINLFRAIVNTAAGVASSLSYGGPVGIALAAITAVLGALEIAAIASQPLPEAGKGKWFTQGDKHSDASGGIPIMIERDEAVIKADAMTDNKEYVVRGTPAQITSALNSQAGGANWAGGAIVKKASWITDKPAQINPGLLVKMEQGGRYKEQDNNNTNSNAETNAILRMIYTETKNNTEEIKTMKTNIRAIVSIKEYREEEKRFDASQKLSGLG